jgi:glycosyltransferase involved in cell wall biosynthesis
MKGVKADVAYINGIYSFYFSILPVLIAKSIPTREILVAGRGMFAAGSVNVKSKKKKAFFTFAKLINLYKGITFHSTNNVEANDIKAILGKSTVIKIAPNLPQKLTHYQTIKREKVKGNLKMISVARVSPEKNTKYALEILINYKGSGSIVFDIYGPIYNQTYWEECKKVIAHLPPNVTVTYKGSLESHLVLEKLTEYHNLFMPTNGENFGHIILESLTTGCPVIISDKTPWRELKTSGVGFDLPLDELNAFVNAIEEFVQMDTEHYNQLSVKAVAFAKEYINDVTSIEANKSLFAS